MPQRAPQRWVAVVLGVPALLVAVMLLRGVTDRLSDTEVRRGVAGRAEVLAIEGNDATVRVAHADRDVVTHITRHGSYDVGDTIAVVTDPVDVNRVSERGVPAPSSPFTRGLFIAALCAAAAAVCWMVNRVSAPPVDEPLGPPMDMVRGGRDALQPDPAVGQRQVR